MEESTSNSASTTRGGKRRIVVTGVGGIAGIMILAGAFAVATIIRRNKSTNTHNHDMPAATPTQTPHTGSGGLRSLLETSSPILETPECVHEHDKIENCYPELDTVETPIKEDESTADVSVEENYSTNQDIANSQFSIEDDASMIVSTHIQQNDHAPAETVEAPVKEDIAAEIIVDENVSNCQHLFNHKSSTEDEIVETPKEEDISTIEDMAQEKVSTCEDLSSCKSSIEHNALSVTLTQINGDHTEPEPETAVEPQTKEDELTTEVIIEEKIFCEDVFTCNSNAKQDASRTSSTKIDDYFPQPETVETPTKEDRSSTEPIVEEKISTCEENFSCKSSTEHEPSQPTLSQVDDYNTSETSVEEDKSMIEVAVEENKSTCDELFSCTSSNENDASTISSTEVEEYSDEQETVEIPIMEEKSATEVAVEKQITHEDLKTVSLWESGEIDVVKDGISVTVSKETVDIDEGSVICHSVKEEQAELQPKGGISVMEVGLSNDVLSKEDPWSPLEEETETENDEDEDEELEEGEREDSEGTHDSSIESNSEAIWPVDSTEEELLLLKDRAQVQGLGENSDKETSENVEEDGLMSRSALATDKEAGLELRSHPSKILSWGTFLVWLLVVVGLVFLLFTCDLPTSYQLNDSQLLSS